MTETKHFINRGYGWTCKRCGGEQPSRVGEPATRARFFHEGEAEANDPALAAPALARWLDAAHQTLVCPHCAIEERIKD